MQKEKRYIYLTGLEVYLAPESFWLCQEFLATSKHGRWHHGRKACKKERLHGRQEAREIQVPGLLFLWKNSLASQENYTNPF
jgi:hypothetical protein